MKTAPKSMICLGEIVGVHGVKGLVKIKIFAEDPQTLADLSPLQDETGKPVFEILQLIPHGNIWLADIENVADRTAAEKMRGKKLYAPRAALPEIKEEDTYYHADLIGMTAEKTDGTKLGTVINVANFGAGDLLDIKPARGNSFYVPFTNAIVPKVDMAAKTITIDPPPGLID